MAVIVFEDGGWPDFAPLTTMKLVSLLRWGTRTLLDSMRATLSREVAPWGGDELAGISREAEEVKCNSQVEGDPGLVDGDVPSFTFYEGQRGRMIELLVDSTLDTQNRIMELRGLSR